MAAAPRDRLVADAPRAASASPDAQPADAASIVIDQVDTACHIRLSGPLTVATIGPIDARLAALRADCAMRVDATGLGALDTAGAWALARLAARVEGAGHSVQMVGLSSGQEALIADIRAALPGSAPAKPAPPALADRLESVGKTVVAGGSYGLDLLEYMGLFVVRLGGALVRPARFPLTALVHHCQQVGVNAVPIVALMSFLIGIVVAFQGATQLRQFGAEVFVVDLIAISVLRELGILLTAVIVAGRTASAFTAAIGAMKMREEIDAMRTLSIDPVLALIVPRVLALIIMLPVLGLIANVAGLLGGALMSWLELGISPAMFRTRLIEETGLNHVLVGMIKAPVFALLIGLIGCHAGMQVKGDTESLGSMTSSAVVRALFAVILADALFSVFFAKIDM